MTEELPTVLAMIAKTSEEQRQRMVQLGWLTQDGDAYRLTPLALLKLKEAMNVR